MNKKIVTLILVALVSLCFLSIVVADNATNDDNNSTNHDETVDNNKTVDNDDDDDKDKTDDKNKTTDKDKKDDKSKNKYILAKNKGNNVKFSDGYKGFRLDYSKSPASSGDEFKSVSTSKARNSNDLKLAIIECYKLDSTGNMAKIMADFIKSGSSNTKVGKAVAASHEKISDHEVVKINNHTEAVFDFEVLKSVSGNESNYFAYKVSFKSINDGGKVINQTTNNLTNLTNTTVNATANTTNATNTTNITPVTQTIDNETNATFLDDLYDYLLFLASALYDVWQPIIDTLINDFLMIVNALEELENLFNAFMDEIQALIDAVDELLDMLGSILGDLAGLLNLLGILVTGIEQLLNLIGALLNFIGGIVSAIISIVQQLLALLSGLINFIAGLISAIISLIQQLISFIWGLISGILGLLSGLINFILGLFDQIMSLLQAIFDFLKSLGSSLISVVENGAIIIVAFLVITVGAFFYNRIR